MRVRNTSARIAIVWLSAVALLLLPLTGASAHETTDLAGFGSGFAHPLRGVDHIVAMVAVGLWGAILGPPALWLLPIVFPAVMALGGALGIVGLPIPWTEFGIAASAIGLGVMVALAARPPLWSAGVLVGAFAIFHGYAHGTELPAAADPLAYSVGFVLATGLLHLSGIALGQSAGWPMGHVAVRAVGGAIALAGVSLLLLR